MHSILSIVQCTLPPAGKIVSLNGSYPQLVQQAGALCSFDTCGCDRFKQGPYKFLPAANRNYFVGSAATEQLLHGRLDIAGNTDRINIPGNIGRISIPHYIGRISIPHYYIGNLVNPGI